MKTAEEWLKWFRDNPPHYDPACCCERCNNGQETFLLASDIKQIQLDAMREGMRRAAEISKEYASAEGPHPEKDLA